MDLPGYPDRDPLDLALERELQASERVLWKARPLRRISWSGFALYFFAIPWTAFALFWTAMAYAGVSSMEPEEGGLLAYAFPLFGVPFILVGLAMLAPPFLPLLFANRTLYAITDRRVLELRLGRRLVTKSVDAERLGSIERSEGRDGAGTLKITIGSHRDSDGDAQTSYLGIGEVAQIMEAESILRDMRERHRHRASLSS